jgi:hypothetical protein
MAAIMVTMMFVFFVFALVIVMMVIVAAIIIIVFHTAHKVHATAASVIVAAMVRPVGYISWRYMQIHRLGVAVNTLFTYYHRIVVHHTGTGRITQFNLTIKAGAKFTGKYDINAQIARIDAGGVK